MKFTKSLICGIALLGLAACGGSDGSDGSDASGTKQVEETSEAIEGVRDSYFVDGACGQACADTHLAKHPLREVLLCHYACVVSKIESDETWDVAAAKESQACFQDCAPINDEQAALSFTEQMQAANECNLNCVQSEDDGE